jgi:hypothetical protein
MLTDHKVSQLNLEQIKAIANYHRSKLFGDLEGGIRAANAILWMSRVPNAKGERLKIVLSSETKLGAPAVVSYRPLKIEFDRAKWPKASLSKDKETNYIAAHELAHLILHNHDAQPYSGIKKPWISFNEDSAEWQANTFADHFLVRDSDVYKYISPDVIADICQVPLEAAERRFRELAKTGQCCCEACFNSRVYRINTDHFCWSCRKCF